MRSTTTSVRVLIAVPVIAIALSGTVAVAVTQQQAPADNVRVTVAVHGEPLLFAAVNHPDAAILTGTHALNRRAAAIARRHPDRRTQAERRIFERIDQMRNHVRNSLKTSAADAEKANLAIASQLKALGGRIEDASLAPNTVTVVLPRSSLDSAVAIPGVELITRAERREPHNASVVDGSPTWHVAGYTGAGATDVGTGSLDSPDARGGPDFAVSDCGVWATHSAFDGRSPAVIKPAGDDGTNYCTHANTIGALVASKHATYRGLAYGADKLLDSSFAKSSSAWLTGFSYNGEPGASDFPEVGNYSFGVGDGGADDDYAAQEVDVLASAFGMARSGSAGNCGMANPPLPVSCSGNVAKRVSSPSSSYNSVSAGAMNPGGTPADRADDAVEPYSSRGPTFGGRKKPELVARGGAAGPGDTDASAWVNAGEGTSFAAPRVAAGMILLASVGVTAPAAQKAILINTTYPIDSTLDGDPSPETYWRPDTGWGELALDLTFPERGNYVAGSVTAGPFNSARFYRMQDAAAGNRATLVWQRRVAPYNWPNGSPESATVYTVSNLDLFGCQTSTTGSCVDNDQDVCGNSVDGPLVTRCGVDTNEQNENTGPWATTSDNQDNVEQIRTVGGTGNATSILKVKNQSPTVEGAASEPFALATKGTADTLATPIPAVTAAVSSAAEKQGQPVTLEMNYSNPSNDLALGSTQAEIVLPTDVELVSGSPTVALGTLAKQGQTGSTGSVSWTVRGTADGLHQITTRVTGTTYSESFRGAQTSDLRIDSTPPQVAISAPVNTQSTADLPVSWQISDTGAGLAGGEVQVSENGGPWQTWRATGLIDGQHSYTGTEGSTYRFRVSATDTLGNTSLWSESATSLVDAVGPTLFVSGPVSGVRGEPVVFVVRAFNLGTPVTVTASTGFELITYHSALGQPATEVIGGTFTAATRTDATQLRATFVARDGLGRPETVTTFVPLNKAVLPIKRKATKIRITKARIKAGKLRLAGTITTGAKGKITLTVSGITAAGKKFRRSMRAKIIANKFKATLNTGKLTKATVTAKYASHPPYTAATAKRKLH